MTFTGLVAVFPKDRRKMSMKNYRRCRLVKFLLLSLVIFLLLSFLPFLLLSLSGGSPFLLKEVTRLSLIEMIFGQRWKTLYQPMQRLPLHSGQDNNSPSFRNPSHLWRAHFGFPFVLIGKWSSVLSIRHRRAPVSKSVELRANQAAAAEAENSNNKASFFLWSLPKKKKKLK